MNRKTLTRVLVVLVLLVVGGLIALNLVETYLDNLLDGGLCPPIVFFEDANGNGLQDPDEISLSATSADFEGASLTLYDSRNQKLGDYEFGCFLPANSSATMSLVVKVPNGYQATTPTRHAFQTAYAMDTLIYVGIQKVP